MLEMINENVSKGYHPNIIYIEVERMLSEKKEDKKRGIKRTNHLILNSSSIK